MDNERRLPKDIKSKYRLSTQLFDFFLTNGYASMKKCNKTWSQSRFVFVLCHKCLFFLHFYCSLIQYIKRFFATKI